MKWLAGLLLLVALPCQAHDGGLGLLDLQKESPGTYRFSFAVKGKGAQKMSPRFPANCKVALLPVYPLQGQVTCPGSLRGLKIGFHAMAGSHPMVLARLQEDGESLTASSQFPAPLILPAELDSGPGFTESLSLGLHHFAGGWDHLLFLLVLLMALRGPLALVIAVTAFTAGHACSITAVGLGWLSVPSAVVEALIALSIVLVAREVLLGRAQTRWPLVAAIGLIHGLGFAGMLQVLGLGRGELLPKLLGFNLGIELAQLALVAALLGLAWVGKKISPTGLIVSRRACAYGAGGMGMAWTLSRSAAILGL